MGVGRIGRIGLARPPTAADPFRLLCSPARRPPLIPSASSVPMGGMEKGGAICGKSLAEGSRRLTLRKPLPLISWHR